MTEAMLHKQVCDERRTAFTTMFMEGHVKYAEIKLPSPFENTDVEVVRRIAEKYRTTISGALNLIVAKGLQELTTELSPEINPKDVNIDSFFKFLDNPLPTKEKITKEKLETWKVEAWLR